MLTDLRNINATTEANLPLLCSVVHEPFTRQRNIRTLRFI